MSDSTKMMIKSDKLYDTLKLIGQIILPAVATLYFALSQVWGFAYGAEIVGTIAALDTFLGVMLSISSAQYNKSEAKFDGHLEIVETDGVKQFSLNVNEDPYLLEDKDEVVFKVNKG